RLKALLVTRGGEARAAIARPHDFHRDGPYPAIDIDGIVEWFLDALAELGGRHAVGSIVATGHGNGAVLVDETGPVLPMMDYEAPTPPEIDARYAAEAPSFGEVFCTTGPGAMQLGKQLLWQAERHPEPFARARHLLTSAQYVAWRLGGRPASEVTQLAAQGHLWDPRAGAPSSLVRRRGWDRLLPPRARAGEALGRLQPALALQTGLSAETEILCGVHDSNANLFRFKAAGLAERTVLSTGTWMIGFARSCPLERLDAARAMVANVDVDGEIVASTLTMTGREHALLAGPVLAPEEAVRGALAGLLDRGTLPLPAFAAHDGIVPGSGGRGRIVGPPPADAAEAGALAALYAALTADACLDALGSRGPIVIDGGLAANGSFAGLLAALRPGEPVAASRSGDGTAIGAGLLWRRFERTQPVPIPDLVAAEPLALPSLPDAATRWRRLAAGAVPAAMPA
ncbi:MAG: carbohydrate kinase, partial [Methylobacteriaceae bacterium]|nr:carbohydrate kinase [Methylobacteriaceae bacterium]